MELTLNSLVNAILTAIPVIGISYLLARVSRSMMGKIITGKKVAYLPYWVFNFVFLFALWGVPLIVLMQLGASVSELTTLFYGVFAISIVYSLKFFAKWKGELDQLNNFFRDALLIGLVVILVALIVPAGLLFSIPL